MVLPSVQSVCRSLASLLRSCAYYPRSVQFGMERGVVIFAVLFLFLSLSTANGEFELRSLPDQCCNSILGGEHVLFKRIVLLAFFCKFWVLIYLSLTLFPTGKSSQRQKNKFF